MSTAHPHLWRSTRLSALLLAATAPGCLLSHSLPDGEPGGVDTPSPAQPADMDPESPAGPGTPAPAEPPSGLPGAPPGSGGGDPPPSAQPEPTQPEPMQPVPSEPSPPSVWDGTLGSHCDASMTDLSSADVWSEDGRVVFLSARQDGTRTILVNDTEGWEPLAEGYSPLAEPRLVGGVATDTVYEYGTGTCGVRAVRDGVSSCSAASPDAVSVFVAAPEQAYAVHGDRVVYFDGAEWRQLGDSLQDSGGMFLRDIWADDSVLFVAAGTGAFRGVPVSGEFERISDLPAETYTAVWAFGEHDVWFGRREGQLLHWVDGEVWEYDALVEADGLAVRSLWGSDGRLFAHTARKLVRWESDRIETVYTADEGVEITGLWGNGPDEVFLAEIRGADAGGECGEARVLFYDGLSVRPL